MRRIAVVVVVCSMVLAAFAPMAVAKGHEPGCSATGHWVAKYAQSGLGPFDEAKTNLGQGWVKPLAHGEAEWLPPGTHVKDFIKFMQTAGFDPYEFFGENWNGAWPSGLEDDGAPACAKYRQVDEG